ncbi:phosphoribosylamine--glycine ligase [Pelotomaculum propionicicum]|uniref:Phosphoribosylamine--glycine ligase n=1 Tax=Pelotomaculum propionicicum TaxID=258475 RepID=A0A4Y7RRH7_9FIRM|nr:phosphoribosylamine--glycine ligase [Pelotomaculum propionicicum]NLI14301.1 phosphoribosylamine--glycine ligase [Peptococcaceae bacterium]TEB10877.1 Phosphoribosylamine--glycine ligase [Pelotomaculum propionicicum]
MKVLVVGGGGREHALVWKLKQSPRVKEIYCAPGNAGIAGDAVCVGISAEDIPSLLAFARDKGIDLTVVGPEAPLCAGLTDQFEQAGLKVFGPSRAAAEIEGSKVVAKDIMAKYNIPTAGYAVFTEPAAAVSYIDRTGAPCVVKAEGLAAGKGVIVALDKQTAVNAVNSIMVDKDFGTAGDRIVVEECLLGEEVSILAFTDGYNVVPMVSSQDHKRAFDNDQGPNTGGMGAYAPAPVYTPELHKQVMDEILVPMIRALDAEGRTYRGVIYAGLMVTEQGPKVLEFNARFGDPETQPVLALLDTDLVEIIDAVLAGRLNKIEIRWKKQASVCVVLASGGYPGAYEKGKVISGLDRVAGNVVVFHAGTAAKEGKIVTAGGRVLGVTATGPDILQAIESAYKAVDNISFEGMQYRRDIGYKAIERIK